MWASHPRRSSQPNDVVWTSACRSASQLEDHVDPPSLQEFGEWNTKPRPLLLYFVHRPRLAHSDRLLFRETSNRDPGIGSTAYSTHGDSLGSLQYGQNLTFLPIDVQKFDS